jgi:hypothetical protein
MDDFIISVRTDNPGTSNNTQFTIPTTGSGYNYNVDCNADGIEEMMGLSGDYTCSYTSAGTYISTLILSQSQPGEQPGVQRPDFQVR